jgi:hypothetical protein
MSVDVGCSAVALTCREADPTAGAGMLVGLM